MGGGSQQSSTSTNQNQSQLDSFINQLVGVNTSNTNQTQTDNTQNAQNTQGSSATNDNSLSQTSSGQVSSTGGDTSGTTNQATTGNQQGTSTAIVAAPEAATLAQVQAFDTGQMNNGLSAAVQQNALQQNTQQNEQIINNTLHQIGSATPNAAGLAEDLSQQAIMSDAQVTSNLAASNQAAQLAGASALQGETQIANPLTQVNNTLSAAQTNGMATTQTQQGTNTSSNVN